MRMQKGLCIELNEEYSVFIGPNGEFVHGKPARETAVGEESYFYPKQALAVEKHKTKKPVWTPIMAALAVAVLFFSVLLPKQEAYAYVQIQVNPGIELGIDEDYQVVSIRELNVDGRILIGELGEWKRHSLDEVLDEVIGLSIKDSTDEIVITTVSDEGNETADEAVVNSIMAISAKVMAGNVAVRLKEASKKQWRASVEKSVPVGQLITDSKSLKNDQSENQATEKSTTEPVKIKEKQSDADKQMGKESKSDEKEQNNEQKAPAGKDKDTPPGQEKRKVTPATEKGNVKPSGQEKRSEVPVQRKENRVSESKKPEAEKGKDAAPGQQEKKDEGTGDKGADNDNASNAKDNKEKPKPAIAGPQNSKEKNAVIEINSADIKKSSINSKDNNGKDKEN